MCADHRPHPMVDKVHGTQFAAESLAPRSKKLTALCSENPIGASQDSTEINGDAAIRCLGGGLLGVHAG